MSTARFTAEVLPDGTIRVPQEIHLVPGKADVTVDTTEVAATQNSLRHFAGTIRSGDTRGG